MFPWYSHGIPMMKYTISQWPFQEPKMEVPQNIALYGTVPPFKDPGIPIESVNQFPWYSHDVIRHNTPQKKPAQLSAPQDSRTNRPGEFTVVICETQWLMVLNSG
jgi:hypothetical protein